MHTNCTLGRGCRWRGGGENGWWETAGEGRKDAPRTRIVYRAADEVRSESSLVQFRSFRMHNRASVLGRASARVAKEKVSLSRYRYVRINHLDDETMIAWWKMITRAHDQRDDLRDKFKICRRSAYFRVSADKRRRRTIRERCNYSTNISFCKMSGVVYLKPEK